MQKKLMMILLGLSSIGAVAQETKPVKGFELNRYLGTWYEIASNPQRFSKGCECTEAHYSLKKKRVMVYNRCLKSGKVSDIVGKAKQVSSADQEAKLKVSFFPLIWADYWVIDLDSEYQTAVVSNRKGSTLWVLSRKPMLDPVEYEAILQRVKSQVDITHLKLTRQKDCR